MKTLKRTLVALAALTVASMSMTAVASADDETTATTEATTAVSAEATTAADSTEASAEATTAATEAETAKPENKGDEKASTVITIGTVTVAPGTKTASVPVSISGNTGFAGTGLGYTYDSKLTLSSVKGGLIEPEEADGTNYKALTSAKSKNITDNGVLYTLEFALPADAKAGDVFAITGSIDTFSDASGKNVSVKMADGAIKVADAETTAATTAASTTKAATKTVKKAGSSPATGEALPIAGAAAAVAVIGGVAIASRKRK